jgi:hypothetical protein
VVFSRAHALLCGTLRGMMPGIWGRDHKQRELISNLDVIYDAVRMRMLLCISVRTPYSVLLYMCPYYYICVRILLCVSSCYISVRLLLCMCPYYCKRVSILLYLSLTLCVLILLYVSSCHSIYVLILPSYYYIYVSSQYYIVSSYCYIFVLILSYTAGMCGVRPATLLYMSSYYYIYVLTHM